MKVIVQEEWYSTAQCIANPMYIYVFGDNTKKVGNGGQAQIRPCNNTFGIATKRAPSNDDAAFFDDSIADYVAMFNDIYRLHVMMSSPLSEEYTLVFPVDGLGTGLSELPKRAPFINSQLSLLLDKYFNVITRHDGTLCMIKR